MSRKTERHLSHLNPTIRQGQLQGQLASGDPVLAYGVGTVIIKLKAEKLQNIEPTGRKHNKPRPANDFIYIQLSGVIWAPLMSRNYIDTTRIRKTQGGIITMVGDQVGNRIIAGHVSLQYTLCRREQ